MLNPFASPDLPFIPPVVVIDFEAIRDDADRTKFGTRGERYRLFHKGALLAESVRSPLFDGARAVIAAGIAEGDIELKTRWKTTGEWSVTSAPKVRSDGFSGGLAWCSTRGVSETAKDIRVVKFVPFDRDGMRRETAPTENDE